MSNRVIPSDNIEEDIRYLRRMLAQVEQHRNPRPVKFIEKLEKEIELLEDAIFIYLDTNIIRVTIPKIWLTKIHKLPALP